MKREKPTEDVLGPPDYEHPIPHPFGGGIVVPRHVIGKITRTRARLSYEIGFLWQAKDMIERANHKDMPTAMKYLVDKIELIGKSIDRALNDFGDTDPRHPPK